MTELEIWLLAVALAMDCFAVSIASGIILKRFDRHTVLTTAFLFGLFQGLMPLIGWWAAGTFSQYIKEFDHWIAMGILSFLGGRMIVESFKEEEERDFNPTSPKVMVTMAIATSIDALAIGISFACLGLGGTSIVYPICVIGFVSFVFSLAGFTFGIRFGKSFAEKLRAELIGGIILIIIGVKILAEHLLTNS
jgi:putative Mn2+ efflux pump MntP